MRVSFCKIHRRCPCLARFLCLRSKPSSSSSLIELHDSGDRLHRHTHAPASSASVVKHDSDPDPIGLSGGVAAADTDPTGLSGEGSPDDKERQPRSHVLPDQPTENGIKSSLRRKDCSESDGVEVRKKTVQWMDFLGKELVEVNEFDSSDAGDSDNEGLSNRGCLCNIL